MAPPSCGLPEEFVDIYISQTMNNKDNGTWPARQETTSQEWEIPFEELTFKEQIGNGKFKYDKVYKGDWHGDVAIKSLNLSSTMLQDEKTLEMFKEDVANFRNTRHDNLEIFMGACMEQPKLAIVTSYCRGETLHNLIHAHKTKFSLNETIQIAQQICLGMGYLHSRNIIHKDLKSKNIFLDNGKVVITDFGLFSLKRLCRNERDGNWLQIPKGWLPYLPPEIMRRLCPSWDCRSANFTFATDIYSFGTIWYELLIGEMPYKHRPPEVIIWQVGRGLKQPLVNFQAPKEVKNILLMCWSIERPQFRDINTHLESIPRRRVQRSSSFQGDNMHIRHLKMQP